jgi:hypothetical protein
MRRADRWNSITIMEDMRCKKGICKITHMACEEEEK